MHPNYDFEKWKYDKIKITSDKKYKTGKFDNYLICTTSFILKKT